MYSSQEIDHHRPLACLVLASALPPPPPTPPSNVSVSQPGGSLLEHRRQELDAGQGSNETALSSQQNTSKCTCARLSVALNISLTGEDRIHDGRGRGGGGGGGKRGRERENKCQTRLNKHLASSIISSSMVKSPMQNLFVNNGSCVEGQCMLCPKRALSLKQSASDWLRKRCNSRELNVGYNCSIYKHTHTLRVHQYHLFTGH